MRQKVPCKTGEGIAGSRSFADATAGFTGKSTHHYFASSRSSFAFSWNDAVIVCSWTGFQNSSFPK
jgi:hypothetical protein